MEPRAYAQGEIPHCPLAPYHVLRIRTRCSAHPSFSPAAPRSRSALLPCSVHRNYQIVVGADKCAPERLTTGARAQPVAYYVRRMICAQADSPSRFPYVILNNTATSRQRIGDRIPEPCHGTRRYPRSSILHCIVSLSFPPFLQLSSPSSPSSPLWVSVALRRLLRHLLGPSPSRPSSPLSVRSSVRSPGCSHGPRRRSILWASVWR